MDWCGTPPACFLQHLKLNPVSSPVTPLSPRDMEAKRRVGNRRETAEPYLQVSCWISTRVDVCSPAAPNSLMMPSPFLLSPPGAGLLHLEGGDHG